MTTLPTDKDDRLEILIDQVGRLTETQTEFKYEMIDRLDRLIQMAEQQAEVAREQKESIDRLATTAERNAATAERNAATAERNAATAERSAATAERNAAIAERHENNITRLVAVVERQSQMLDTLMQGQQQ